ncbi:MAG: hypothetical protein P8Y97_23110, partial [Candidatus Lokiarchaeota archaeon]
NGEISLHGSEFINQEYLNRLIARIWNVENYDKLFIKQKRNALKNIIEEKLTRTGKHAFLIAYQWDENGIEIKNKYEIAYKYKRHLDDFFASINLDLEQQEYAFAYQKSTISSDRSSDGSILLEIITIDSSKKQKRQEVVRSLRKTEDYLRKIEAPPAFQDFMENYKNKREGVYLEENLFDTLLNYYSDYETSAKIWKSFVEANLEEAKRYGFDTTNYFNDKYFANWKEVQKLQRLFWGLVLDFRHPLTGHQFTMTEWMNGNNFELHHWQTAEGSENKYECYWAAVISFPKKANLVNECHPIHNDITFDGENGKLWEQTFRSAINSIMNGQIPKFKNIDTDFLNQFHIGWTDANANEFGTYENHEIIELINLFLLLI